VFSSHDSYVRKAKNSLRSTMNRKVATLSETQTPDHCSLAFALACLIYHEKLTWLTRTAAFKNFNSKVLHLKRGVVCNNSHTMAL